MSSTELVYEPSRGLMRVSLVCHICFALLFVLILLDDMASWHAPFWLFTVIGVLGTAVIPIDTYPWYRGRNNPSDDD